MWVLPTAQSNLIAAMCKQPARGAPSDAAGPIGCWPWASCQPSRVTVRFGPVLTVVRPNPNPIPNPQSPILIDPIYPTGFLLLFRPLSNDCSQASSHSHPSHVLLLLGTASTRRQHQHQHVHVQPFKGPRSWLFPHNRPPWPGSKLRFRVASSTVHPSNVHPSNPSHPPPPPLHHSTALHRPRTVSCHYVNGELSPFFRNRSPLTYGHCSPLGGRAWVSCKLIDCVGLSVGSVR
ncbi:hypothetical protein BZA05DRAFT_173646 [Tricharina praecox]|uniref:uncharacterized protein n=1 Tax=Tricharina praecox TaxID=43433 RepID=UPI0022204EB6|nr:uncharacterized protein BZA05DRAFT_173646 [Tricharina praecox]KAI5844299.1 hypothetical protein BZA05DRAFT_173646 [Tricharina praecox]